MFQRENIGVTAPASVKSGGEIKEPELAAVKPALEVSIDRSRLGCRGREYMNCINRCTMLSR